MEQLLKILNTFKDKRSDYLQTHTWATMPEDDRANAVAEWAEPVAKNIINDGYFQIGNHYCIRVDILELYYNEEDENGLKDPIMYHTNDRIPRHVKNSGIHNLPYFDVGSFNLHISGIDITFENSTEHYRGFSSNTLAVIITFPKFWTTLPPSILISLQSSRWDVPMYLLEMVLSVINDLCSSVSSK